MLGLERSFAEGERRGEFVAEVLRLFDVAEVAESWYAAVGAKGTTKAIIEITYSSVYGERWKLHSDQFVPERL